MKDISLQYIEETLALYSDEQYEEATIRLAELVKQASQQSKWWNYLADCYYHTRQWQAVVDTMPQVLELGSTDYRPVVLQRLAVAHSHLGNRELALDYLRQAVDAGLKSRRSLLEEEAFEGYHDNPAFRQLAGQLNNDQPDRVTGWRTDLEFLAAEIIRLHPSGRDVVATESFQKAYQTLYDEIPTLSDPIITARLHRLWVMVGDGHSTMYPMLNYPMIPLATYWFEDGVYIVDAYDADLIGVRLMAIGDVSIEIILDRLPEVVPQDNPQTVKWLGMMLLRMPTILTLFGATNNPDSATLTLKQKDGATRQITLEGKTFSERSPSLPIPHDVSPPLYLQRNDQNIWMRSIPEGLYVQFNNVRNQGNNTLAAFAEQLKAKILDGSVDTIILDVRHNNGGNNTLIAPLLKALILYEALVEKCRLFVIISRTTFSACQNFVNRLERWCSPVFVGEPTGSRPNFIGEDTNVVLPYSGLRGSISCFLWQDSLAWDDRVWIAPDIPAPLTADAYFRGEDPALDAIRHVLDAEEPS